MNTQQKSIQLLIVDDNPSFVELIRILLEEIGILDPLVAHNFNQAILLAEHNHIDFCLLDVNLGNEGQTGIDLAYEIRHIYPDIPIIYLTSFYTEEVFELAKPTRPSSFLNKEVSRLKLQQAIDLALLHQANILGNNKTSRSPSSTSKFFFKIGDAYKGIDIDKVSFFFAEDKVTYAQVGDRKYPIELMLKTLEERLHPKFIRIQKSYLANINCIESVNFKESFIVIEGQTLPIGLHYKKALISQLHFFK